MGYYCIAQAGLKLLSSNDPPASASQVVRTTGIYHHTWQNMYSLKVSYAKLWIIVSFKSSSCFDLPIISALSFQFREIAGSLLGSPSVPCRVGFVTHPSGITVLSFFLSSISKTIVFIYIFSTF
jgi:hypothetical protein